MFGTNDIPPLKQTMEEVIQEYRNGYTIFDRKPVNDDLVFVYMEKTCDSNEAEVVIGTERLFLREMNMGDYEALYSVLADSDNMQHYPYAFDEGRVRDWAFKNTDYPALYSYCKYTNTASIRTAEAIGMRFDREYSDEVNGITHVSVIYRRT